MPSENKYTISYKGQKFPMRYVFDKEIAALRAHKSGKFQEEPILEWIRDKGLKGTYLDLGAHVGNHTLFFLKFCQAEQVISVEAHPDIYDLLSENMIHNCSEEQRRIQLLNFAAWSESGKRIRMAPIPTNNAGHTHVRNSGGRRGEKVDAIVDSLAVDSLDLQGVTLLKIDIEDTEEEALAGALRTIKRCKPVIVIERHNSVQLKAAQKQLGPIGYQVTTRWTGVHTFAFECKK